MSGVTDRTPSVGTEGYAEAGPSSGAFNLLAPGAIDGRTFLRFNISQELQARGLTGLLVAVGEVVRYRLYASVAEGLSQNFQLRDNLSVGLRFLNDGSARYVFVSTGAGAITSAANGGIAGLGGTTFLGDSSSLASLASGSISGTFGDSSIATGSGGAGTGDPTPYASGQDVFFRLGDRVSHDMNGNGVKDAGESGIPGVRVAVVWHGTYGALGGGDDLTVTATTDAAGNYTVGFLPACNYTVTVNTADLSADLRPDRPAELVRAVAAHVGFLRSEGGTV